MILFLIIFCKGIGKSFIENLVKYMGQEVLNY
jgi:hypothetical protein